MKRSVLVTGGAGFIGSFIVDELLARGHEVRVLDNLYPEVHLKGMKPDYLNPAAEFIEGDVRERADVERALEGVDTVFHQAAIVGVGQSMYEVERYVDTNVRGTAMLLDAVVNGNANVKKIIIASSMSTYGEGAYKCEKCGIVQAGLRPEAQLAKQEWELKCAECGGVLKPTHTPETKFQDCNSVYAISKKAQEDMVLNVCSAYGIKACALRYFNVYGPRQSLSNPYTGVAAIFTSRLKNGKAPVVNEDGLQSRDFVSVHDVVQANMLAMESNAADGRAFNVGTGKGQTILGVAETLAKLLGKEIAPEIGGTFRKGDVRHCFADISEIKSTLGFEPKVSFEQGMRELIEWGKNAEAEDKFDAAAAELKRRNLM